jgi:hypothetical protein
MLPRSTPKRSMASIAYSEQVGTYLQDAGSQGEITSLYPRSNHSAMLRAICMFQYAGSGSLLRSMRAARLLL